MIREANIDDLDTLVRLAEELHGKSPNHSKAYPFLEGEARAFILGAMIDDHTLILIDEDKLGFFIASVSLHWSKTFKVANEVATYVSEKSCNKQMLRQMLKRFESWAKDKGARYVSLGVSSGAVNNDRLTQTYEKMGYTKNTVILSKGLDIW